MKFFKNNITYIGFIFAIALAIITYTIPFNSSYPINAGIFWVIFLLLITVFISLISENKFLVSQNNAFTEREQITYEVKKVIKNSDGSVFILTQELKDYPKGTAISLYKEEDEFEQFLFVGSISEIQSNSLTQLFIPGLSLDQVNFLLNKDTWPKLKIKTTFPFHLILTSWQENMELRNNHMELLSLISKPKSKNDRIISVIPDLKDPETSSG